MFKVTYKKTATSAEFWKKFKTEQQAKVFANALGTRHISTVKVQYPAGLAQQVEQRTCNAKVNSSIPLTGTNSMSIAQWIEQQPSKLQVTGSNPVRHTTQIIVL